MHRAFVYACQAATRGLLLCAALPLVLIGVAGEFLAELADELNPDVPHDLD